MNELGNIIKSEDKIAINYKKIDPFLRMDIKELCKDTMKKTKIIFSKLIFVANLSLFVTGCMNPLDGEGVGDPNPVELLEGPGQGGETGYLGTLIELFKTDSDGNREDDCNAQWPNAFPGQTTPFAADAQFDIDNGTILITAKDCEGNAIATDPGQLSYSNEVVQAYLQLNLSHPEFSIFVNLTNQQGEATGYFLDGADENGDVRYSLLQCNDEISGKFVHVWTTSKHQTDYQLTAINFDNGEASKTNYNVNIVEFPQETFYEVHEQNGLFTYRVYEDGLVEDMTTDESSNCHIVNARGL